jgi:GNAT superfamily N-acetyltransferase
MDEFVNEQLGICIRGHYCQLYVMRNAYNPEDVIGFYALNFDSLDLDEDDKMDSKSGISSSETPNVDDEYEDMFWNKQHYPAMEISYLAVNRKYKHQGYGTIIMHDIVERVKQQTLAGCQFLTVHALSTQADSSVEFYVKQGFAPCEYPNPAKDTCRMYRSLY